jgi:hypothetical protein
MVENEVLELFKQHLITIGEGAKLLNINQLEFMQKCSEAGIDVIDEI